MNQGAMFMSLLVYDAGQGPGNVNCRVAEKVRKGFQASTMVLGTAKSVG